MAANDHGVQGRERRCAARRCTRCQRHLRIRRAAAWRLDHHFDQARVQPQRSLRGSAMLARIIQWSGKNSVLVLLATLFVVAAGVVAVTKMPIDALPDLSDVQVIVYTEYP